MIIDELNKKIADIESLANDKTSTIESKVSDLTDGLLMVADAVDIIPEMVDEKITAITKEFSTIKDTVSKVKAQKGDNGRDGIDGLDGRDGKDGKDGSPDTPKDIADKLNTLEEVLDPKVIKGSSEYVNKTDLNRTISTLENQTRFLIQSNASKSSGTSFTGVVTDSTLTGVGTDASPLSVVATSASDVAVTVRAATTAALAGSPTYDNGTSGVGATLTRGTNGVLPSQDGISLQVADRILVKNQSSTLQNGVYEVTSLGSASSKWVLTRTTDADTTEELDELVVTVSEGSTNRGTVWGQQTNNPTVGTSAITFATVVSTAVTQATSGTQAIYQIPTLTGTARQITRGTANFKYNPTNDLFTIRGVGMTFPAANASGVLTNNGSGTLSWAAAGGGTPAGSDTQIQYNNSGAFGASSVFTYDSSVNSFRAGANPTQIKIDGGANEAFIFASSARIGILTTNNTMKGFLRDVSSNLNTVGQISSTGTKIEVDETNDIISLKGGANGTSITIDDVNEQITIGNIKAYDDDAAAGTAGLTAGMVYMTTGSGSAPLNTAGILMIKQ